MRSFRLRSALSLLLASTVLSFGAAQPAGAQTSPAQADRVPAREVFSGRLAAIPGHRPAWANAANDAGPIAAGQTVRLTFALTRAPELQQAYDQLLTDQQTVGSSRYHRWLTPAQIGAQFGPTQHDVDALTGWLRSRGFQVEAVYPSRVFIQVTGPAQVAGRALATEIHRYRVGGATALAPIAEPSLPQALAPLVRAIGGLAGTPITHDLHKTIGVGTLPADGRAGPSFTVPVPNGTAYNLLTPGDFATIYNLGPVYSSGVTGGGQTIAILGGSRLAPNDVLQYETLTLPTGPQYQPTYSIPPGLTDPGIAGLLPNATGNDTGNEGEAQLDFNRAFGTAPGATIDMVVAQDWLSNTVDNLTPMFQFVANQNPVPAVMSVSISGCEAGPNAAANDHTLDSIFSQFAMEGISVFFSSGDSGAAGCADHNAAPVAATNFLAINQFCSTGYVTCVGGTEFADTANTASYWNTKNAKDFTSAIGPIPEGAWNEPSYLDSNGATVYALGGTGGGPSTVIPKPAWQTGVGVPADGFRDTPDISFSASSHNGYFACLSFNDPGTPAATPVPNCVPNSQGAFSFVIFSGTSASAPSMAGIAALAAQKLGGRQGNLNPLLYQLAATSPMAFHDTTPASSGVGACDVTMPSMCNNSTASATALTGGLVGYPLTAGYDLATGLGSLNVNNFIQAVVPGPGGASPSFTLTASVPSLTLTAGATGSATLTFTSINGFAGGLNAICSVAGPGSGAAAPACLVTPGNASLSSGSAQSSTLSIGTRGTQAGHTTHTAALGGAGSVLGGSVLSGSVALAGLLFLLLPARRLRAHGWRALGCMVLLAGSLAAVSGCSSGGSLFSQGTPTTKGAYTVTITATGTSNGQPAPATATLTIPVTVQ